MERDYLEFPVFDQLDHLLDQVEAIDSFDWLVKLCDDIAFGDKKANDNVQKYRLHRPRYISRDSLIHLNCLIKLIINVCETPLILRLVDQTMLVIGHECSFIRNGLVL